MNIIYKPDILKILTGNTSSFYDIEPNVIISSGFTLNIENFNNNNISKIDIIDNIINYIDVINKYAINVKISNSGSTFDFVTNPDIYCVMLSGDTTPVTINYLIMEILLDDIPTTTTTTTKTSATTTTTTIISNGTNITNPIIYYNSGTSWSGGDLEPPHDAYLHLIHDNITGWTLDSLKILFIDNIVGCLDNNISLSAITFNLSKRGSNILLSGIYENGIYDIYISVKDSAKNTTSSYILNIIINDLPPKIIYQPYILNSNLTGNTSTFSGATSGITANIPIDSGFIFNLGGFDGLIIDRLDIINNVVNYVIDPIDLNINKYMLDILIVGRSHTNRDMLIYENVTKPGRYCVKMSLSNSSGNDIVAYFIMDVVFDMSIYSEGYWQNNKVWIDFTLWLDHPKPIWAI